MPGEKAYYQLQTKVKSHSFGTKKLRMKTGLLLEQSDRTQKQKVSLEESGEKNQIQVGKLEATGKSLSQNREGK